MPAARFALFNLAFRPFFLLGGVFFVAALIRWGLFLNGWISWPGTLSPLAWHVHEMTLGFGLAVVFGFLLTAVQNWTGVPGVSGPGLFALVALWSLGRITLWFAPDVGYVWLALPDLASMALAGYYFTRPLVLRRQWRNLVLLPGLAAMALLHLAMLMPALTWNGAALLWALVLFMTVIGGRVIPMFTANRFGLSRRVEPPWYLWFLVALTLAVVVVSARGELTTTVGRLLLALLGAAQAIRVIRWYHRAIWRDPLIWTLHLSYLAIPLTALIMATAGPASPLGHNSLHILALQGVTLMILSMMSRVSLGHTGRPIQAPFWLGTAAGMIMVAVLARGLMPAIWPAASQAGFTVAMITSVLAMAAFVCHYTPILGKPRADNKPG